MLLKTPEASSRVCPRQTWRSRFCARRTSPCAAIFLSFVGSWLAVWQGVTRRWPPKIVLMGNGVDIRWVAASNLFGAGSHAQSHGYPTQRVDSLPRKFSIDLALIPARSPLLENCIFRIACKQIQTRSYKARAEKVLKVPESTDRVASSRLRRTKRCSNFRYALVMHLWF